MSLFRSLNLDRSAAYVSSSRRVPLETELSTPLHIPKARDAVSLGHALLLPRGGTGMAAHNDSWPSQTRFRAAAAEPSRPRGLMLGRMLILTIRTFVPVSITVVTYWKGESRRDCAASVQFSDFIISLRRRGHHNGWTGRCANTNVATNTWDRSSAAIRSWLHPETRDSSQPCLVQHIEMSHLTLHFAARDRVGAEMTSDTPKTVGTDLASHLHCEWPRSRGVLPAPAVSRAWRTGPS